MAVRVKAVQAGLSSGLRGLWVAAASMVLIGSVVAAEGSAATAASRHASPSHDKNSRAQYLRDGADNPRAAEQWFVNQRLTRGMTNPAAYAAAEKVALVRAQRARSVRSALAAGVQTPIWHSLGPQPLNNPNPTFNAGVTVPAQNYSGRVITLATSGSGSTEQAWLGSAGGGVWSTTLSSSSPTWAPRTDFQASLALGAVAIAPSNTQVVYAGTGEDDKGGDSFYGQGLLVSTDGGADWADNNSGGCLSGAGVSAVAVDPANPSHIYVATSDGFYTSTNSGQTLVQPVTITYPAGDGTCSTLPAPNVSAMVVDPASFSTVFIAVPGVGIEKSTDGGATFSVLSGGLPAAASFGNTALAISPNYVFDQTVYAEINNCANFASCPAGTTVWKTTNGGTSWNNTFAPDVTVQNFYYGSGGSSSTDQGFYDLAIAVDPSNTSVVYVAGIGISMSTNGGATWTGATGCTSNVRGCSLGDFTIHPDDHALVFDSSGNLLIGNDGGVYELPASDASTGNPGTDASPNYVDLNTNLATLQMYPGGVQSGDATNVLAGTQDNGPDLYQGSEPWTVVGQGGDGGYNLIDPGNTSVQYSTSDGLLTATTDTWATTDASVTTPPFVSNNFVPPIALGNSAGSLSGLTVYYGGERPYKSTDGGVSWTALTGSYVPASPATDQNDVSAIAVAPSNPSVVYCAWGDGTLQVSQDGGTTWHTITPTALETGNDHWITHIAVDPNNAAHILVTFSGFTFPQGGKAFGSQAHVVETSNANAATPTWVDDTGSGLPGVPTNSVIFEGASYIVATDVGVYSASTLVGASTVWNLLGANLPLVQVEDISLSADGSTLVAFTHGRGAWDLSLVPGAPSGVVAVPGNASASVSWSAPGSDGGSAISAYTVTAADSTNAANGGETCTWTSGALSCGVIGLTNGDSYTFTVKATNGVGAGSPSAPSAPIVPAGDPGAPSGVVAARGNGSATVSWSAPGSNGGSAISGYTVIASDSTNTTHGGESCVWTSGALSCRVTGLTNGDSYTFRVIATNSVGNSPPSSASNAVVPASVPGAPTLVKVKPQNHGLKATWTAPATDGGSPITGYTVTARRGSSTHSCETTSASVLDCTIHGLKNGKLYVVSVVATNGIGKSVGSNTKSAKPRSS